MGTSRSLLVGMQQNLTLNGYISLHFGGNSLSLMTTLACNSWTKALDGIQC